MTHESERHDPDGPPRILLAVDDDTISYEAAVKVAEWFRDDAEVTALHVGTVVPATALMAPAIVGGLGYPIVTVPALRENRERIRTEARDIATRAAQLADGEPRVETGDPAEMILEVADATDSDVIVVGTGDRSWTSRLFDRSVSSTVVRRSSCSVLIVRQTDLEEPPPES